MTVLASGMALAHLKYLSTIPYLLAMENKSNHTISPEQLQAIGNGILAYVKPIAAAYAEKLVGQPLEAPPGGQFFALFNANGAPISIAPTREAAVGNAEEHELVAASLH